MNPVVVFAVIAALVGAATVIGLVWRTRQGAVQRVDGATVVSARDVPGVGSWASGATLLQFSTEVCAPCSAARVVLGDVAAGRDGVTHVDLDLTHRPDLASRFRIMQTPTTFILDRRGVVQARIGGAPKRSAIEAELNRILAVA
jgi:thiol-disulfide isomerase/thioredoxin